MKKISIIIPVYNAMTAGGGYINRCVDSVLNQKDFSMDDVEILLINDGSTDNSLEVLREIEQKNPKTVTLINQKNVGVARTRNKAMKLATGEYTTFLDQDDWIDDDFLCSLWGVARSKGADVVISGYRRPNSKGDVRRVFRPSNTLYGRYTISAAWAKLHKTDFLRKNMVEFFDNSYGEDIPFMVTENSRADVCVIMPYVGYNWFDNEKSVSNTSQKSLTQKNIDDIVKLFSKISSIPVEHNVRNFNYFLLRTAVFYLLFSGRSAVKYDFLQAKRQIFTILADRDEIFEKKELHRLLMAPKGEKMRVASVVAIFILLEKTCLLSVFASAWCQKPQS